MEGQALLGRCVSVNRVFAARSLSMIHARISYALASEDVRGEGDAATRGGGSDATDRDDSMRRQ